MQDSVRQRAERYRVEDVPAANVPGTRLANILQLLEAGRPASETTQAFLASRGLHALSSYAKGGMADADFAKAAQAEQEARRGAAEQARAEATARADARNAEMQAHQQAIEADRLRRESDPRCIARRRNQALREKYGIPGYVEQDHFQRLMAILTRLDNRGRVAETEMVWQVGYTLLDRVIRCLAQWEQDADGRRGWWQGRLQQVVGLAERFLEVTTELEPVYLGEQGERLSFHPYLEHRRWLVVEVLPLTLLPVAELFSRLEALRRPVYLTRRPRPQRADVHQPRPPGPIRVPLLRRRNVASKEGMAQRGRNGAGAQ